MLLGASGDTVALACGASQTGFGRTGTVDWITTPKVTGDSPITGVTGKGYFLNTTSGTITVNLPAGAAGSIISMSDYARTWNTNAVTVTPNGSEKIGGGIAGDSAVLSTQAQSVTLVYVDSTQGWVNVQDSTSAIKGGTFIVATGGTPACGTTCGDYKVHKFTGPGTFCVSAIATCAADNAVAYMVVAGGGGGGGGCGSGYCAGGAGAGGFREGTTAPIVPYTASPLAAATGITVSAAPYTITVGSGGAGAPGTLNTAPAGTPGTVSTFDSITSAGGGGGGSRNTPSAGVYVGQPGASGGGAGQADNTPSSNAFGTGNDPATTPAQGTNGGPSSFPAGSPSDSGGGGGGGATVSGGAAAPGTAVGGVGGNGATTSISATPTIYAGGGGGAGTPNSGGCGGTGGGGDGSGPGQCTTAGTINTGGGGGAGSGASCRTGGLGGSGVVIIRYKFQ